METAGLNRNSPFFDPGYWDGFGEAFRKLNWKPGGDGAIDLVTGLSASNNTVFYEVGKRVQDVDPFALPKMARAFGLGATTGITGVIEVPGVIPDPDWKSQRNRRRVGARRRRQHGDRAGLRAGHAAANGGGLRGDCERRHGLSAAVDPEDRIEQRAAGSKSFRLKS